MRLRLRLFCEIHPLLYLYQLYLQESYNIPTLNKVIWWLSIKSHNKIASIHQLCSKQSNTWVAMLW